MKNLCLMSAAAACLTAVQAQVPGAISVGVKEAPVPTGARVQTVVVGGFQPAATAGGNPIPQFQFTPEFVVAQPGEVVRFMFLGNNHSVVQTTMEGPCSPMANGFNTGYMPNMNNDLSGAPTMDLPVTNTQPLYMSCLQVTHCGRGMIFTVNPPPEGQFGSHSAFKNVAVRAGNPDLQLAGIQAAAPVSQVQSTVQIQVGPVGAAAAAPTGTTVQGTGRTGDGQPCGCSCLCGAGQAAPAGDGMGSFGGVVGMMPMAPMGRVVMAMAGVSTMEQGAIFNDMRSIQA